MSDESTSADGLINLEVRCLTGEGLTLNVHYTTLGREVHRMVSEQLPCKRGAKLALHHMESRLSLCKTLHEQGIAGAATLSCTWIPTNLYYGWCYLRGFKNVDETELQGLTKLEFDPHGEYLHKLPRTLEKLTFGSGFNQRMDQVTLPSGLQGLAFADGFNRSMDRVTLPSGLQA